MKNKVSLIYQDYGSSILIFITGETTDDAYGKWLSMYNWNCTSSEPNWISDKICSCWSSRERLKENLFQLRIGELDKKISKISKGIKGGFLNKARELSEADFKAIPTESYRSVNSVVLPFEMGEIAAEKEDTDFKDSVLTYAFANRD